MENHRLVISPERRLRQRWEESFRAAGSPSDDELLLETAQANEFDRKGWKW